MKKEKKKQQQQQQQQQQKKKHIHWNEISVWNLKTLYVCLKKKG